ncbi:N-formylglutamate amidohydrolase [Salinibacterium sp. NK8237]|uniref:N-formylglutamate amidohydrolase n=1 Tax=Salinibacterium sp. NK8237 TaxID=2792038 RepID=UPI0018CE62DE|nr:N-formylglutamate amidohydrolase [Salinibacterium sp. NK8237]MBH0130582.1 N-formylglutamate amidohydrolase [Salinibacterium sp. NK8237]
MSDGASPTLIPAGTHFTAADITFYADPENRTLNEALSEADLLVSCPHSGAAIPEELSEFLAPEFTRRLQFDFSDVSTSAVVRRWAEIDPRIVYVENPHPRMIRDPNRAKPSDLAGSLAAALERVRAAGPYQPVDLSGVDAVRPVTFAFYPLLLVPQDEAQLRHLTDTFAAVAERGLGVYERTRDELRARFIAIKLEQARTSAQPHHFTALSFHDTMNHTAARDGAVCVARAPKDRLPQIVALSNRGDNEGDPRGDEPVTMAPVTLRRLADAHRTAFGAHSPSDVGLNIPYLGGQEIIDAAAHFERVREDAETAGLSLSAVQAEFLREYLLGENNTAILSQPGTGWVAPAPEHVDRVARACKAAWDSFHAR